jgi:hypothetical protein
MNEYKKFMFSCIEYFSNRENLSILKKVLTEFPQSFISAYCFFSSRTDFVIGIFQNSSVPGTRTFALVKYFQS